MVGMTAKRLYGKSYHNKETWVIMSLFKQQQQKQRNLQNDTETDRATGIQKIAKKRGKKKAGKWYPL